MTCPSGFEFLHRPYPYSREPFRLGLQDLVAYEGRYFSIPAFGLLLDKRLFTAASSHPVSTPIKLYINKDAGLSQSIEPSLNASGYEVATPHYADYILDMRTLLEEVAALHAEDSQYSTDEFFIAHMQRNRAIYDIPNTSASGTSDLEYVHPEPANTVPVAPSSLVTSGNTVELGAQQFQDIDLDEVMWQPFTRPKAPRTGPSDIPLEPVFPAVLVDGNLPTFSDLDKENFGKLGFDASTSGGMIITGDRLAVGTSIKLLTGSGQFAAPQGTFREDVEWAQFPAGDELNRYYETTQSGCINASGRQAIYNVPGPLTDDTVYLLDVSDDAGSGLLIQNYPANYAATSGIDKNGTAHPGVHNTSKLLYSLNEFSANNLAVGRSLINGKKVFGHFCGSETSPNGASITSLLKYSDGNTVYSFGGVDEPFLGGGTFSSVDWAVQDNTLSPVTWGQTFVSSFQPRIGIFGGANSTTFTLGDIMSTSDGVTWFKLYQQWGTMDRMVYPGGQQAAGGDKATDTISYETHVYREGTNVVTGEFEWIELDPPESPIFTTQAVTYYRDTYTIGNIMSFFFNRKPNHGFVHANGETQIQWSETGAFQVPTLPRHNKISPISSAPRSTQQSPLTSYSSSTYVVGFYPSWKIRLSVTTNNQITIPKSMAITPAVVTEISFHPDVPMTPSRVDSYGPIVWDPVTSLHYLYFNTTFSGPSYFAKMDSSFQIIHINRVESTDVILNGRPAILDI